MSIHLIIKEFIGDPKDITEFDKGNEILKLETQSKNYLEYTFHKEHSQLIRRFINGQIQEDIIEYIKSTKLIIHIEKKVLILYSGKSYSDFICRRIKSAIAFDVKSKKIDFLKLFKFFQKESVSYEPLKIKINNFINEPYMIASIDASINMKEKFLDLIQNHTENVMSLKIKLEDFGDVEITNDFSLIVYNQNVDLINLFDFVLYPLEVDINGSRT